MRKNPIRYVWMALGILCLVLGTIGVCKRESNDEENKEIHHCDGNDLNGNRFYYDEQRTDRPCSSCDRVDFSFLIFWIESRNCQRRESKGNNI